MADHIVASRLWTAGINSLIDPLFLPDNQVQWSFNTINRGGVYQTRPGYSSLPDSTLRTTEPRGFTIFTPSDGVPIMVKAVGINIRYSKGPSFSTWTTLGGITLDGLNGPVYFETVVKGARTNSDGSLTIFDPRPYLVIQTGVSRAYMWDGSALTQMEPAKNETPIGTWMKWVGSRLWVAYGNKLVASNLLEPDNFTNDGSDLSGAGYFTFPEPITGLGMTPDQNTLLVFTASTTSSIQANILDRSLWSTTPAFQKIILPEIGCVAGRTIVNQYGMVWWLSEGGLIGLNDALLAFRSSRIHYQDQEMSRSKSNLSNNLSGACAGAYENFLVVSVPSGSLYNAHTWVMDQGILDSVETQSPPAWASCWTGTNPVQWITSFVNGRSRCFHMSRGQFLDQSDNSPVSDIFESFTPLRKDISYDGDDVRTVRDITSSVETKYMSFSDGGYHAWKYAEFMMVELARNVHVDGFYASRHSNYKQVLNKDIVATVDTFDGVTNLETIDTRLRQTRRIRTTDDESMDSDDDPLVEDNVRTRNKDLGFFLFIEWTGEAGIESIILCGSPTGDNQGGSVEEDEGTQRYILPEGMGAITTDSPVDPSLVTSPISGNVTPVTPRSSDSDYNTLV